MYKTINFVGKIWQHSTNKWKYIINIFVGSPNGHLTPKVAPPPGVNGDICTKRGSHSFAVLACTCKTQTQPLSVNKFHNMYLTYFYYIHALLTLQKNVSYCLLSIQIKKKSVTILTGNSGKWRHFRSVFRPRHIEILVNTRQSCQKYAN